ncbi:MAG: NUDIX hydrolase [Thermomicrobiales bacterium]
MAPTGRDGEPFDPFDLPFDGPRATDRWQEPQRPHEVTTGTQRAFDGRLLHVRVDAVRLPSGAMSAREIVEHPGSAVVLPLTAEREVLMIRQYRHAFGRYLLELPAGLVDPGEDAIATAGRELIEETGYAATALRHLTTVLASPGYTQERSALVLATGCHAVAHAADEDEPIDVLRVPLADLGALLEPGNTAIENAQAMLGVMWLLRLDALGELDAGIAELETP